MKYGIELFRIDEWVLRARRDSRCLIIHECGGKSTTYTLSSVYHPPSKYLLWSCNMCDKVAPEGIVAVWIMMNWPGTNRYY